MNIAILLFPNWIFFTRRAGVPAHQAVRRRDRSQPVPHVLGLHAIHMARHEQIQLATAGNPGPHLAT